MGVNLGSAYGRIDIDTSGISRAVDSAKASVNGLQDSIAKMGDSMKAKGAKLTAGVTLPIVALGVKAVMAASDTSESLNKMNVVFGESAAAMEGWSETSTWRLGMTQQQALEAIGTYGNLFTAMGMGQQPAADMSKSLVTLAADLASFNNIDPSEALDKLRAGLLGEAEPLRALGVNLSQTAIEAQAVKSGLVNVAVGTELVKAKSIALQEAHAKQAEILKKYGAESNEAAKIALKVATAEEALSKAMAGKVPPLTALQKAQAAYQLIMEQTTTAQGDFARTSDGMANSLRIAKARFGEAASTLGAQLLPIGLQAVQMVNGLMEKFAELTEPMQRTIVIVAAVAAAMGPVAMAVGAVMAAISPLTIAIGALIALGALLYTAWTNDWGGIQEKVGAVAGVLAAVWNNTLLPALQAVWGFIQTYLLPIFSLIGQIIGQVVRIEVELLQAAFEKVLPVFQTVAGFIRTVIEKLVELDKKLKIVEKGWNAIKTALEFVIDKLRKFLEALKNVQVPEWLKGGSPPPMANWLADIADQARAATRSLGMMGAGMGGMGGLALAGAGGYGGGGDVYVGGDTNTFYVTDNGTAALTAAMIDERRRARLDASMGVYRG